MKKLYLDITIGNSTKIIALNLKLLNETKNIENNILFDLKTEK